MTANCPPQAISAPHSRLPGLSSQALGSPAGPEGRAAACTAAGRSHTFWAQVSPGSFPGTHRPAVCRLPGSRPAQHRALTPQPPPALSGMRVPVGSSREPGQASPRVGSASGALTGVGVFGNPSVAVAPAYWLEPRRGDPGPACPSRAPPQRPSSTEPAGALGLAQHTGAWHAPRLSGSQKPWGLGTTQPAAPPRPVPQCWPGTGVTHGLRPPPVPGTKALWVTASIINHI